MNKLEFKDIFSVLDDYDVLLIDLWGVIVEGTYIYPNVVDNVNRLLAQKKVFFVSNAPRPNSTSFERIKSWGINVLPNMVMTAGEIARQLIAESGFPPVIYHLGSDCNFDILEGLQYPITTDLRQANILLMTLSCDEGENLTEFDELLKLAAQLGTINICANPDTIIPNQGVRRYCPGYFAAKLEQYGAKVIYTGKPYITIFDKIFEQIPTVNKDRILMIGDTFETDILGAFNAGIHSALVMSGNAEKFHNNYESMEEKLEGLAIAAANAGVRPNFVIKLTIANK